MNATLIDFPNRLMVAQPDEAKMKIVVDELLAIVGEVALTNSNGLLDRLIRYVQLACAELMDQLHVIGYEGVYTKAERTLLCKWIAIFLEHLQKYYPGFYNLHSQVPVWIGEQGILKLEKAANVSYSKLKHKIQDPQLLAILVHDGKLSFTDDSLTYYRLHHRQVVHQSIVQFCLQTQSEDFDKQLIDHLIGLNYDESAFINYYIEGVEREVELESGFQGQVQILQQHRKRLFLISIRNKQGQDNRALEVLSDYVLELLKEKRVQLFGQTSVSSGPQKLYNQEIGSYKIKVSFSANVLAYLTKLHINCGYMTADTKTDLFSFLAARVQTAGIKDNTLSALSLGVKYRQVVHTTAVQTRAMLVKMLKQIDLEFK